jgi:hypothetical protein
MKTFRTLTFIGAAVLISACGSDATAAPEITRVEAPLANNTCRTGWILGSGYNGESVCVPEAP